MISLLLIGFCVFWYMVIYCLLSVLLYHFKFRSSKLFVFDEIVISTSFNINITHSFNDYPDHSHGNSSSSSSSDGATPNGLTTNHLTPTDGTIKDLAETNRVMEALAQKYPGHIVKPGLNYDQFIWFNYGGSVSKIMIVHSSITELVAVIKFPFASSTLYSAPLPQETYSFIMRGDCLTCTDASTLALPRRQFEHFFIPTMNSFALSVPQQCTMLVYVRGILPFAILRLLLDCFFRSLDFVQLFKLLWCISRYTLNELIWNQKI
ncbi:hypothetical protein SAMD00019534_109580 [Acytostelium subglobosum LB1]|uniref:hypothetical protein n=1 Tax=Acytostelium subglobosum LB1 TaxID=1410327 RepID=UPI000644E06F|nr:hypothetical protein SAMD00019534_109580 [Acytostelium subglobosum LB1]GAM27782.1 hypothetical protein SAMD00019534_109580 [Acytostelium subglobosum LB1]|eukprot:XP_012749441.1 hypothetical protein SAMD00019534_109580 [Acytostelium subglobosum LB1]